MDFSKLFKKSMVVIAILFVGLLCLGVGCVNLYYNLLSAKHLASLKEKEAKRDSIAAKQSYIALLNTAHADTAIVDSATGETTLKINHTAISNKELPPLTTVNFSFTSDSNQIYKTQQTEKNTRNDRTIALLTDSIVRLNRHISALDTQTDSLTDKVFEYSNKFVSVSQVRRKKGDSANYKRDSIAYKYLARLHVTPYKIPAKIFGVTVGAKGTLLKIDSEDPALRFVSSDSSHLNYDGASEFSFRQIERESGAALSVTVNYGFHNNIWQVGPGIRFYFLKNVNAYMAFYYNITKKYFNPTGSLTYRIKNF